MRSILIVLLAICSLALTDSVITKQPNYPYIDAHVHTSFDNEEQQDSGIKVTEEEFLKQAAAANIVAVVNHTYDGDKGYYTSNDVKIINCVGVRETFNVADIEAGLVQKKYNCIKIYLGYIHRYAYDDIYKPLYEISKQYGTPVVFHTGDTYSSKGKLKYADPLTIDEVAVDYPEVTFILAHMGNPWFVSAAEVAYKNPNVYIDVSALMVGDFTESNEEVITNNIRNPLKWAYNYLESSEKLLFGTDWPLVHFNQYINVVKQSLPESEWQNVFFGNAVKVFKLNREELLSRSNKGDDSKP